MYVCMYVCMYIYTKVEKPKTSWVRVNIISKKHFQFSQSQMIRVFYIIFYSVFYITFTHGRRLCKTTEIFVRIENVLLFNIYIYIYICTYVYR